MTVYHTGRYKYSKLPSWIREGYADYIGKGSFDFKKELYNFQNNKSETKFEKSGLYKEYNLMVYYLLEIKKIPIGELFNGEFNKTSVQNELRKINL